MLREAWVLVIGTAGGFSAEKLTVLEFGSETLCQTARKQFVQARGAAGLYAPFTICLKTHEVERFGKQQPGRAK